MPEYDSRRAARHFLGLLGRSAWKSLLLVLASLAVAGLIAFFPEHAGLNLAARWSLFILLFCAGLWITEAMPAFAVSLLAMGLQIAILGRPGGVFATDAHDWERFSAPWGSPLIWLFFGGFVLAIAAQRTGLDYWMARRALKSFGRRPALVVLGVMLTTAVLSMFISNTATATLMVAMLGPLFLKREADDSVAKAMLLGVALGANIGGMGTIIGSPPNAIAAGALDEVAAVDFFQWMLYAVPPAALLLVLGWSFLLLRYLGRNGFVPREDLTLSIEQPPNVPQLKQLIVVGTFATTVLLWLTSTWHGTPTTVVSFLPTCVLTATGILGPDDLRDIPWKVLLLIAGGLSLGVGVTDTGLADWITGKLPLDGVSPLIVMLMFCYLTVVLSNLMSNTAAANMIIPLALALAVTSQSDPRMVIPVALCASAAMCLPISTPPNAIICSTGRLRTVDLLWLGILLGLLAPLVVLLWARCTVWLAWV